LSRATTSEKCNRVANTEGGRLDKTDLLQCIIISLTQRLHRPLKLGKAGRAPSLFLCATVPLCLKNLVHIVFIDERI
jgi:hypothetical protein